MNLNDIHKVYLIGIGGIGMSSLARWFKNRGCLVAGYDRTPTSLTTELIHEGIDIVYGDKVEEITSPFRSQKAEKDTLIIYTPAIPQEHSIFAYFKTIGYSIKKRSEVLGIITHDHFCIAVAGTHGKTTISTMIAHILHDSGYGCSAFLGGISVNYHSNLLLSSNQIMVVEADEFDRSFLTLSPNIAVITSMDADHLEIYENIDQLKESFHLFADKLHHNGVLIKKKGLSLSKSGVTYSINEMADIGIGNLQLINSRYCFDYVSAQQTIKNLCLGISGLHNIENSLPAIKIALELGIKEEKIRQALTSFLGVKRRFEYIINSDSLIFIDDYAHHPVELNTCIQSVKQLYPEKKLTVLFQPHLYSRTRDFAKEFAESLEQADELFLLDVYPAREQPIKGINSSIILDQVKLKDKRLIKKEELFHFVNKDNVELLLTLGAGDIDDLVTPLKKHLISTNQTR